MPVLMGLIENIQTKMKIAFQSTNEAFRFFDIGNCEVIKPEHFVLGVRFFNQKISLVDCMQLFHTVDGKKDGMLDEQEFSVLYMDDNMDAN